MIRVVGLTRPVSHFTTDSFSIREIHSWAFWGLAAGCQVATGKESPLAIISPLRYTVSSIIHLVRPARTSSDDVATRTWCCTSTEGTEGVEKWRQ